MTLYRKGLVTFEESLRQSTNPDDFKLKVAGISSTSDAGWSEYDKTSAGGDEGGGKGGAGGAPPPDDDLQIERF